MQTLNDPSPLSDLAVPQWRCDPRVQLAAERTMLAWLRTGLALMGFGFVVARFGLFLRELAATGNQHAPAGHGGSLFLGVALAGIGVGVIVVAGDRYRRYSAALTAGLDVPPPSAAFGIAVSAFLAVLGVCIVFYLLIFA